MKYSLNGAWMFSEAGKNNWKNASVPGCNYLDLMACGDIDDPFFGLNEEKVNYISEKDWEYKKTFSLADADLNSDEILLNCKMLDTVCDIYVNNNCIAHTDNCFISYSFMVKKYLKIGENEIRIVFYSPVNYVKNIYDKESAPINSNGQNGIVHIRKPQSHFGWDWGPVLPPSGISGDIEIKCVNYAEIDYLNITQNHTDGCVTVNANTQINKFSEKETTVKTKIICPDGTIYEKQGQNVSFDIDNPELWWTKELSQKECQPLYTVVSELYCGEELIDKCEKKIGLRTIELNRNRDEYGINFQFVLNGVPLFIKGANYIPSDSFITRFDSQKLSALIDAALFSNMNLIRVWGGGYYESDAFYNMCDEKGLLVWQDFQFACQAYPFFKEEFLNNVKNEIAFNVKRLNHHASLALWNGNNEIEAMSSSWIYMKDYVKWTEKFFYNILESELRKYDLSTPFIPGSPCGVDYSKGINSDNVGDTHLWGVWHGLQPMTYYRKRMTRFCSEFGFESLPDYKTVAAFAGDREYSLNDEVFSSHQKCVGGNDKMIYYMATRFDMPEKFEDCIYLSQVTQQECIADATEHWRRNKGRCNGAVYWQFNDCWPTCSWSGYDYYGNYKALQYKAKHFNAPLCVSVEDTEEYIKIFVLNDLNESQNAEVEYIIFDFEKGSLECRKTSAVIDKLENKLIFELNTKDILSRFHSENTGVCARLYQNGELINQKVILFENEKKLNLPKAKLKCKIEMNANNLDITVSSDKFARFVKFESSLSSVPFSDNFFDLLPGQSVKITMARDNSLTLREQAESISVKSICNVKPDKNKLKNLLLKFKVFTSPVNIGNMIYHGRGQQDYKF